MSMSSINKKPIYLPKEEEAAMALADKAVYDSLEQGSFDFAAETISSYRSLARISELGQARILHGVNQYWTEVPHEDNDDYFAWSVRSTGYNGRTIERHISVWEMLSGSYIPHQYLSEIRTHTVRQLFKIYSLVVVPKKSEVNYKFLPQDLEVDDDEWLALSEATDDQRVAEIVAKIKDKPRNKNFMSLKIDKRGDLYVYQNNEAFSIGYLNVSEDSPLVQKAIRRIVDNAGVTEKDEY
jgi:hypothetical protein